MAKEDNLKSYKKGQSGNPNGRPKKTINTILEQLNVEGYEIPTAAQVRDAYLYLTVMPQDELKAIVGDKDSPMLFRICASNILSKKGFEIVEKMLDRAIGRATQRTEVTGEQGKPIQLSYDLSKLSIDELKQLRDLTTKIERD